MFQNLIEFDFSKNYLFFGVKSRLRKNVRVTIQDRIVSSGLSLVVYTRTQPPKAYRNITEALSHLMK